MTADMRGTKQTFCTTCGAAYPLTARFCGVDGTELRVEVPAPAAAPAPAQSGEKACPRCKTKFPGYAKFCPTDATRLVESHAAEVANIGPSNVVSAGPSGGPSQRGNAAALGEAVANSNSSSVTQASAVPVQNSDDSWFANRAQVTDEVIGKVFAGKYKIESLLGEGGMARVYKATHLEIEKPVVIKLMHSHLPSKGTAVKRFELEIKVTAKLNHPNLVSVFDGGVMNGNPYLVMEYIRGESLREFISNRGQLPFNQCIAIASQICAGLQEAHNEGVVHRDLKPENIMLRVQSDRPDWVKVVDFGIAHLKQGGHKLTATGVAVGTVDYMSPEYLSDKPIDHRADIYALGVMLYELLTGRCPFESEVPEAVLAKHLWTNPTPPSNLRRDMTPGCALDLIVEKALEKEPADRFQSTTEMRRALQEAMSNPAGA